jgi:membrane-associated phospholipid phosphatase
VAKKNSTSSLPFHFLSVIFHPVFVPTMLMAFMVFFCESIGASILPKDKTTYITVVAYVTILFPLLVVFLLWKLDFIDSMRMQGIKERIAPLIASISIYFWVFWVFHKQFNAPHFLQSMLLGVFTATSILFLINIFYKVSLHSAAWGGATMLGFLLLSTHQTNALYFLIAIVIITTLVCIARLQLKDHTKQEVIMGLIVGAFAQLISHFIIA